MLIMQVGKQVPIDKKMVMCRQSYEQIDVGRDRQQTDRRMADRQLTYKKTTRQTDR